MLSKLYPERPTDYKLNSRVILPKPLDVENEYSCEYKRRAYLEAFHSHKKEGKQSQRIIENSNQGTSCELTKTLKSSNVSGGLQASVQDFNCEFVVFKGKILL